MYKKIKSAETGQVHSGIVSSSNGKFSLRPGFGADRTVLHPIGACEKVLVDGEEWQGRLDRIFEVKGRRDRSGKPVFVQFFVPEKRITEVKISLPQQTGRTAAEYASSEGTAVVRSGRREIAKALLKATVLFEPYGGLVTARLMFSYKGEVRVGCMKRFSPAEALSIGCPPEVIARLQTCDGLDRYDGLPIEKSFAHTLCGETCKV